MKAKSKLLNITSDLNGQYQATFTIPKDCLEELANLKDFELTIQVKKFSKPKSLNANNYLWKLCSLLAAKLGSTKEEIYRHELRDYSSIWTVEHLKPNTYKYLKSQENEENADFRVVEKLGEENGLIVTRLYLGSSKFTQEQMSVLLNGVVQDCKEQGVETEPRERIDYLINNWKGK